MMQTSHTVILSLFFLTAGLSACADKDESITNTALVSVPEFVTQLSRQKGVDYGGVFAVVTINGEEQRFDFSNGDTTSFEVGGIEKDAENAIRVDWREIFQGSNLDLAHQEGMLYIASSDTSASLPFEYVREDYDNDGDGKPNLTERQMGTCPISLPCTIVEPVMINIPAGNFLMGAGEAGSFETEYPQHAVSVNAFSLAETEVTWADWEVCVDVAACTPVVVDDALSGIDNLRSHPLGGVSYPQIIQYINWINEESSGGYRLPTEAEFEYALRAETTTVTPHGAETDNYCEYLNGFNGNGDCQDGYMWSSPVKSFPANQFGLYDMNGNVEEWTADCWHANYEGAPNTSEAWLEENDGDCSAGALRGNNYYFDSKVYRSATRRRQVRTGFSNFMEGFRLARD